MKFLKKKSGSSGSSTTDAKTKKSSGGGGGEGGLLTVLKGVRLVGMVPLVGDGDQRGRRGWDLRLRPVAAGKSPPILQAVAASAVILATGGYAAGGSLLALSLTKSGRTLGLDGCAPRAWHREPRDSA